ncbi:MAG TPA: hypothetical protein VFO77_05150, partial [Actinoplanes sp.]|nr:hypothetical protein [Actinoplanes sp.]
AGCDPDSHTDANADAGRDVDSDPHADPDTHSDPPAGRNADPDAGRDAGRDSHPDPEPDADPNPDADADAFHHRRPGTDHLPGGGADQRSGVLSQHDHHDGQLLDHPRPAVRIQPADHRHALHE